MLLEKRSKLIKEVSMWRRRPIWQYGTVWPFVLVYAALGVAYLLSLSDHHEYDDVQIPAAFNLRTTINFSDVLTVNATNTTAESGLEKRSLPTLRSVLILLAFPIVGVLHLFVWLLTQWSVDVACLLLYRRVHDIRQAQYVKVVPVSHRGSKTLCPLSATLSFTYQKRTYTFNSKKGVFSKPENPTSHPFQYYLSRVRGLSLPEVEAARQSHGLNIFDIPLPTFGELYKEQAMAPFFVFQVFCVALWCLDEYWYYSLLTLGLLLVFEGTVVKSRLRNLAVLRQMIVPPSELRVCRAGKWHTLKSSELVPGDVVFLQRRKEHFILPCDLLLLTGQCITNEAILTGESTPQLKESIAHRAPHERLDLRVDKVHVLFGGTKLLQHVSDKRQNRLMNAPEDGCVAYVLRTGFNTSQGKLVRTILYSSERVTANNRESFLFIAFLLVFALAASGYVLYEGLAEVRLGQRSLWKLLLECTLIITSVVPPELPMELSLAVNTSLMNLARQGIFCTEPFRIPFAGCVSHCCFDKTGTLTDEHLRLQGLVHLIGERDKPYNLIAAERLRDSVLAVEPTLGVSPSELVMAACHSLIPEADSLAGDPLELAIFQHINWGLSSNDVIVSRKGPRRVLRIRHRFHFQAALKRMTTIVSLEHRDTLTLAVCVKGAPETLAAFLDPRHVSLSEYTSCYEHFALQGRRVIALGWRPLTPPPHISLDNLSALSRDELERELRFAGFVVFECPLKPDSGAVCTTLRNASHQLIMVTGDNELTACQVARELGIVCRTLLVSRDGPQGPLWHILTTMSHNASPQQLRWHELDVQRYDLCVLGCHIQYLSSHVLPHVRVFARATPEQKSQVIVRLKQHGFISLMCGDGTNDVGALKQAHVGVALLNSAATTMTPSASTATSQTINKNKRSVKSQRSTSLRASVASSSTLSSGSPSFLQRLKSLMETAAKEQDQQYQPLVQLGDASIASPFTCKSSSISPVIDILRQGRCTLVTTHQMFKILALHCLIYAYSLSVLYLDGIKFGDMQATIIGFLTALCFLFISRSKPLEKLSAQRPPTSVFNLYMGFSVLGQFVIHLAVLIYVVQHAQTLSGGVKPKPDADFAPSLVNSAVFLIMAIMQVATFAINYEGHPFMEGLAANKPLYRLLLATAGMLLLATTQVLPAFNHNFQLAPLPPELSRLLTIAMGVDVLLAWFWERLCKRLLY